MKFKTGLLTGFAAGYVLGSKAGRQRYEQIRRLAVKVSEHPAAKALGDQVAALVSVGRNALANGVSAAGDRIRDAVNRRSA